MSEKEIVAKSGKLTAVKGMNDVLPPDSAAVEWLEGRVRSLMMRYAYRNIRTPIVERTPLFTRGLGEVTDIVEKEMYSFEDRLNGDPLTLRPEATAGVVRAAVEHSLLYDGGKRLYYMGPMFRHERPQRGRYRQFDQIGAEALGFPGAEVDAELILLAVALWKDVGLSDVRRVGRSTVSDGENPVVVGRVRLQAGVVIRDGLAYGAAGGARDGFGVDPVRPAVERALDPEAGLVRALVSPGQVDGRGRHRGGRQV